MHGAQQALMPMQPNWPPTLSQLMALLILAGHGVAVSQANPATDVLTFTGAADGTAARDVNTTITDFSATDAIDTVGLGDLGTVYFEGAPDGLDDAVAYGVIVVNSASYANAAAAEDAVIAVTSVGNNTTNAGIIVFLNSTTGTAQAIYDNDIDNDGNLTDASVLLTFENITTLADLASVMSADSFVI